MKKSFAIWFLISALFVGCASGPYTPKSNPDNPETKGAPVVLLDKDLRRTLGVDSPVLLQRDPSNRLKVQVSLHNRTNSDTLHIQVQTLFKNANGMVLYSEVGSEVPWQTLTLTPNQTTVYTQTALTPEASTASVRVRYQVRK